MIFKSCTYRIWVCSFRGKLVGYSIISFPKKIKKARIYSIAVLKKFHGKGIGRRLLMKMVKEAQKGNYEKISLEVAVDNLKAITLYEKLNFLKTGLKKGYYSDGKAAMTMLLHL